VTGFLGTGLYFGTTEYDESKRKEKIQKLTFGENQIKHSFTPDLLSNIDHTEELLFLKNIQYLHHVPNLYMDI
jgi:hypothetical protein